MNKTRGLFVRWQNLDTTSRSGEAGSEADWTGTELRNSLRSIEWDLEDLEDTVNIVEKNPQKFKLDKRELFARRQFINATRDEVKIMKERLHFNRAKDLDITANQALLDIESPDIITYKSPSPYQYSGGATTNMSHSNTKYSKLENQPDSPSRFDSHEVNEQFLVQTRMLNQQDDQLNVINDSVGQLKTVSRQIFNELDEQAV